MFLLCAVEVCFACDCVTLPEKESFENAEIVFEGELIGTTDVALETAHTFLVQKSLKGLNTDVVFLFGGHTDCDYTFHPDVIYRVYARKFEDKLVTGICSGNKVLRMKPISASKTLATASWLDTNKYVLVIIGFAFALFLLIWFLRAKVGTRRNKRLVRR